MNITDRLTAFKKLPMLPTLAQARRFEDFSAGIDAGEKALKAEIKTQRDHTMPRVLP